ncbi:MAG: zf-HC2 domain-containing protein [Parvibaculum sp.]|nr:zf-HC2 domain-containing protein [Parvibaculum sp.]
MTCHKTEFLITEYLEVDLSGRQRAILEQHLRECAHCRQELEVAQKTQAQLRSWQDEPVPHWNRVPEALVRPAKPSSVSGFFGWQWAPLAVSFVLAMAVLTNVRISNTPDGMVIAFGDDASVSEAVVLEQLARFEGQQRQQQEERMQALTVRMEERQDAANVQLIESVVAQFGETTSRSLEQVIAYFDEQRQQDLQVLQSSYQQLADSDYQTVRSVQQLATYVQYQAGSR